MNKGFQAVVMGLTAVGLLYGLTGFKYPESDLQIWAVSQEPTTQMEVKEGEQILVDPLGYLWVPNRNNLIEFYRGGGVISGDEGRDERPGQALLAPRLWDVFDSSGQKVTSLTLPGNVTIQTVGEDYIQGIWTDGSGTEYVRMYSLDRGG